jgi:alkylation response protein AidB-like acyl-CoA dehydrogenase
VAIIHHPDMRRMLMTMKSHVEACRALAYWHLRPARSAHGQRTDAAARNVILSGEFMIPIVKGWSAPR